MNRNYGDRFMIMDEREKQILQTVGEFTKRLPKFSDGRVDYSDSDTAPTVTAFIKYRDDILLLKRSDAVRTYKGRWCTVAGYLDEMKPIRKKVLEEVHEELGIDETNVLSIRMGKPYEFKDSEVDMTWLVHPALVELKNRPDIKLDWEHTDYKWVRPEELKNFDTVPKLDKSWENVFM